MTKHNHPLRPIKRPTIKIAAQEGFDQERLDHVLRKTQAERKRRGKITRQFAFALSGSL